MNQPRLYLCLVLHNHQPIGNFDDVFESAYQDSYRPFLDVFESFPDLRISLHLSGCLLEWLEKHHPDYIDRVAALAQQGRIEILGGAQYEPILTMLPQRDRLGQIRSFSRLLEKRFSVPVHGMWIPERVWEPCLASDLSDANMHYTVLDDFHFRCAGLTTEQLHGYYLTEDQGRLLRVFPGSERLRYLIPFKSPAETIEYCRQVAAEHPHSVLVFGDDGEKFGTWPDTKKHVYEKGWLRDFFAALTENQDWLRTATLVETLENTPPRGKIYLPNVSYREMTEWALPVQRQLTYQSLVHEMETDPRWPELRTFMSGGLWRNFKAKYYEGDELYWRMMYVSELVHQAEQRGAPQAVIDDARTALYRGQCNCAYWHGAFGGLYLPHLRNAIYQQLILAEQVIERQARGECNWIDSQHADYNFDGRPEIRLANERLTAWITPEQGGWLVGLDWRDGGLNLLATMQRRPEAYHQKVLGGSDLQASATASIHDHVRLKRSDLADFLVYDLRPRKSLIDHFWDDADGIQEVFDGSALDRGDFADGPYRAKLRGKDQLLQVMMVRDGNAWGLPLRITKGVTMEAGGDELRVDYLIEGIPEGERYRFGIEFNFAGLPGGQDDRFFAGPEGSTLGTLDQWLDVTQQRELQLIDQWQSLRVTLSADQDTGFWAFPIQTVSQSESGIELVHQSVMVQPHWQIEGDTDGRWAVRLRLAVERMAVAVPFRVPLTATATPLAAE